MALLSFSILFLLAATKVCSFSQETPKRTFPHSIFARDGTESSSGEHGGYYYNFFSDGTGWVEYINGPSDGEYSVQWQDSGSWIGGKGWSQGTSRVINYNATFETSGNAFLTVYGTTTDPDLDYYILENYGSYNPSIGAVHKGSVETDDGTYDVYVTTRVGVPSVGGGRTITRFWSVRTAKRSSGSVTVANHFNAWASLGMNVGVLGYQIVATEGYRSSGSSRVTTWE
ncbi:hypothetical protein AJ79_03620 [Helicocarpus griseus UAMH5409]|uniref:Endo-1,4-beta-xylanase n=1 Tax=Helicocarpus griseus UAMH5409 TaxID=1447875 RepID=A0A2B7XWV6_9EURO|nr:hypothetical protein AJ79_03620 [Helicocarpus griseus UAMH5409]